MFLFRTVLLMVFLLNTANATICYTAVNGFTSITDTKEKFADREQDILDKIDDIGESAKARADKELRIKYLNNRITKIRIANLILLKKINFNLSKGQ